MSCLLPLLLALATAPAGAQEPAEAAAPVEAAAEEAAAPVEAAAEEAAAAPQPLDFPPFDAPMTDEAEIDRKTQEVSSGLRCPVCQGLSVNDSPADGARAMKARIRELVVMGYSRVQIEDYFVDRYGAWVKLEPPHDGRHAAVWALPLAFVLVGVGVVGWRVRSSRSTPSATSGPATGPSGAEASAAAAAPDDAAATPDDAAVAPDDADELAPYRRRILQELGLSQDPVTGATPGEA